MIPSLNKVALTFNDVSIVPKYSEVKRRSTVSLQTQFTKQHKIDIPLVAAPMDTVCEADMAHALMELGGVGVIHRFCSVDRQVEIVTDVIRRRGSNFTTDSVMCAAVGVGEDEVYRVHHLVDVGCNVLVIDVAHGHHKNIIDFLCSIRPVLDVNAHVDIIAGNVATGYGAQFLIDEGLVDGVRVGVGGGSQCETRIRTGVGVPQFQAVLNVCDHLSLCGYEHVPVIADGGIRYPGDVVKSLAAGASTVMIGSLFAGTVESPGDHVILGEWPNTKRCKIYRGSASATSKLQLSGHAMNVEGTSRISEVRGSVRDMVSDILDGIRSACSYVGATNLVELRNNTEFIPITPAGHTEARPHGNL